ncbi:MAG TPA: hypothetical protein QGI72_03575 [Poseidonia sp.]|nr:hypothetical protein [Poseidonia sp.]
MQETQNSEIISFEEMIASTSQAAPKWTKNARTVLAYSSGRLPSNTEQITWQPIAGAGSSPGPIKMSESMRSLHQRIVRGEA